MSNSCASRLLAVQSVHLRVAGHFYAADFGHHLGLLPASEQLEAEAQLARGSCKPWPSLARRKASALNAASYLRRWSGDTPLFLAVISELSIRPSSVGHSDTTSGVHYVS